MHNFVLFLFRACKERMGVHALQTDLARTALSKVRVFSLASILSCLTEQRSYFYPPSLSRARPSVRDICFILGCIIGFNAEV